MVKSLLIVASFLVVTAVHALEIDEKLTIRFLKVSNTKKTVLINRGAEDGLVLGDHAKFFVTSGVIARGVVEKVSPSRSIWSLYRVVDPAEITDGKVLNLKIASPVKITEDPSKSLKDEVVPAGSDKMDMKDAGKDEGKDEAPVLDDSDKKELEGLGIDESEKPTKKETPPAKKEKAKKSEQKEVSMEEVPVYNGSTAKNWEVWGTLYVNSLSGTVDNPNSNASNSTAATTSTVDFSAGLEHYFLASDNFFKDVSIIGFVHKRTVESGQDIKVTSDWFEFGGGVNYHFYNPTASLGRPIGFVTLNGGTGSATLKDTVVSNGVSTETSTKGTNMFIAGGVGAKYILSNGFGARALLDYYSSSESYTYTGGVTVKRTLAGPRIQFGLSYRF